MIAAWGCGGGSSPRKDAEAPSANPVVKFVGFDASRELVEALGDGRVQGLVLQNPYRMGYVAVQTLVRHLEKGEIEAKVSTGEAMATPENMGDPEIAKLLNPPRFQGKGAVHRGQGEGLADHGDPERDDP